MSSGRKEELNKYQGAVNPITQGVIWKQLLRYFAPLLAASFLQLLYNTADTVIAGRFVGKIALTAVGGSAGQIYAMVTEFMIGLSGGAGVILSQAYGARSKKLLDDGLHNAVALALVLGALFMVTGLIVSGPALRLAGAPEETMAQSVLYLRIVFAGIISNALYNMGAGVLRAVGDSRRPLRFLMISSGLNIALDLLFVVCFKMGVGGAAFATVLSQGVSAVSCIIFCFKKNKDIRPRKDELRPQPAVMKKVIRIGLPIAAQNGLVSISMVALQRVTNGFGKTVMASYTVSMRIEQFIQQPFSSLSAAISTFAGQNIGASQEKRAQNGLKVSVRIGIVFAFAVLAVYLVCADLIVGCFVSKKAVISIGTKALIMTGCFYAPLSLIHTVRGFLNGAGDVSFALINGLTEVVCRVGLSLILTNISGISYWGIWITTSATWVATAAVCVIRYRKGKWKLKALT